MVKVKPSMIAQARQSVKGPPTLIEVIARAVIVRDGHVLVCWSVAGDYGYLPGGHVEFGERAADALARELIEEMGLKARVGDLLVTTENAFVIHGHRTGARMYHEINLVFHVEPRWKTRNSAKLPKVKSLEHKIEFRWIPIADLARVHVLPTETREWLSTSVVKRAKSRGRDGFLTQKRWPQSFD